MFADELLDLRLAASTPQARTRLLTKLLQHMATAVDKTCEVALAHAVAAAHQLANDRLTFLAGAKQLESLLGQLELVLDQALELGELRLISHHHGALPACRCV